MLLNVLFVLWCRGCQCEQLLKHILGCRTSAWIFRAAINAFTQSTTVDDEMEVRLVASGPLLHPLDEGRQLLLEAFDHGPGLILYAGRHGLYLLPHVGSDRPQLLVKTAGQGLQLGLETPVG